MNGPFVIQQFNQSLYYLFGLGVVEKIIRFRVRPEPTPLLTVLVDWYRGQDCYGRSRRFALSWVPDRDNTVITPSERYFLDFLLERTQQLDPD